MPRRSILIAPILVLGCCLNAGCWTRRFELDEYRTTCLSARNALPVAVEIERLFPATDHFITHYGFSPEPRTWNTEAFFGGRYRLTMQVPVEIDYTAHSVTRVIGEPVFFLTVATRVELLPDGRASLAFDTSSGRRFSLREWELVRAAGGDLLPLGLRPEPKPVKNFEVFVAQARKDRVPISLLEASRTATDKPSVAK